jgi:hypothetical protein
MIRGGTRVRGPSLARQIMAVCTRDTETGDPVRLSAQVDGRWGLISGKVCGENNAILYWAD